MIKTIITYAAALVIAGAVCGTDLYARSDLDKVASVSPSSMDTGFSKRDNGLSETVSGRKESLNGFAWNYGYDITLRENTLTIKVAINLIPGRGVTRPELNRAGLMWEKGIEQMWGSRYSIEDSTGRRYPIAVDVSFKGPVFHHQVIVRPGKGRTDELNWNLLDSPELVAHEFGHMIGVFDEYEHGALKPAVPVIDGTSIMTENPGSGMKTHARHYGGFSKWFIQKTKSNNVRIVHE